MVVFRKSGPVDPYFNGIPEIKVLLFLNCQLRLSKDNRRRVSHIGFDRANEILSGRVFWSGEITQVAKFRPCESQNQKTTRFLTKITRKHSKNTA